MTRAARGTAAAIASPHCPVCFAPEGWHRADCPRLPGLYEAQPTQEDEAFEFAELLNGWASARPRTVPASPTEEAAC